MTTPDEGIYDEYFRITREYKTLYGEKTILLLQVGAFFEVYGLKHQETGEISGSLITIMADICQLNISEKKAQFNDLQILMAGFRDYTIDKYLNKLVENGYTVPVFVQEKKGKIIKRVLDQVYSPGTLLSCDTVSSPNMTNNIMCIWMDVYKPFVKKSRTLETNIRNNIVYGVSVVNIYTGESSLFQHETQYILNTTTFDELERYLSVFSPSELILITPFTGSELQNVVQYAGIKTNTIHYVNAKDKTDKLVYKKIKRCTEQVYIKQIITSFYQEETYNACSEFQRDDIATQSFCYLLNFIQEHNPNLIKRIATPDFNNASDRMILANHTLGQLNIIDDTISNSKQYGQVSSVLSLLNKCCTPMGRRKFQYQLTNPTYNEEWLNKEYAMTTLLLSNECNYFVNTFRKELHKIKDMDKICRQLVTNKIYPSSIYQLFESIQYIQQINVCLCETPEISEYLCSELFEVSIIQNSYENINNICATLTDFIGSNFILDACATTSSMTSFTSNIIVEGVSQPLDRVMSEYKQYMDEFNFIRGYFNDVMRIHENTTETEYIKIHETDKSGLSLQITSKRTKALKLYLMKQEGRIPGESPSPPRSDAYKNVDDFNIDHFKFEKTSATICTIESPRLQHITREIQKCKEQMNDLIAKAYLSIISSFVSDHFIEIERLAKYVANIDVIICKAYIAKQHNYCCPSIDSSSTKSFVNANGLRHCLIEHIQQNELYVANDVSVGLENNIDGFLLYGTNAVGKTSLIRSLGIAVIMAQSGLFVPCSQFIYKPYTAIFSRILGNDNLFKGLSTFAVEMSELRVILKMADANSLVLGDELCSGTEMESALSIFVAGLMELSKKNSSYIFATHFHEITRYSEIQGLPKLGLKHMEVSYNRELDCLVYDRLLKNGSGPRIYGLEVCKSLYLEKEFMESAYSIRNKYYPDNRGDLSNDPSVYNRRKVRGKCEICNTSMGEETHHLLQQKDADKNGFIGGVHKNHPANLLTVCEKCHDKIHYSGDIESGKDKVGTVKKKTTKGYILL